MTIWLILGVITVGVLVALTAPLFRRHRGGLPRPSHEIAIYRDQLAELQREVDSGRILPVEARLAEVEIQRKILAAADSVDPAENERAAPHRLPQAVALLLVAAIVPIGALAVYLSVGSPGEPSPPFDPARAAARVQAEERAREMTVLVEKLAERLKQEPDNLEGWALLARSYSALQRDADAAAAYERAYELSGRSVTYAGDYGAALVAAAGAHVTPAAQALFAQVLEADPSEPQARFYLALAKAQAGQAREAIAMWRSLEIDSPPDAPWVPTVREMIRNVAADSGIDPGSIPATSRAPIRQASGPSDEDIAAAQSMSPEDQQKMIQDMVAGLAKRLEANPDDLEGWKRLGRSYLVLEDAARAKQAYSRALALAPTDMALLGDYAQATLLASGPAALPQQSVDALRTRLDSDGSDPTALWLVGLAEADAGNSRAAAELWERLLPQLPPGTPAHDNLRARIAALPPAG
ncbi:MAG: c-type cytochrome biogenesis protein CcmI [Dongiaceae bacterium]